MANLTDTMHLLEIEIARQQAYIAKHGEANDLNPDDQWEQYKRDAEFNLQKWDQLRLIRNKFIFNQEKYV